MCEENAMNGVSLCGCQCGKKFFSKKKQIESLNQYLSALEEKAADVREYISELKGGVQ